MTYQLTDPNYPLVIGIDNRGSAARNAPRHGFRVPLLANRTRRIADNRIARIRELRASWKLSDMYSALYTHTHTHTRTHESVQSRASTHLDNATLQRVLSTTGTEDRGVLTNDGDGVSSPDLGTR